MQSSHWYKEVILKNAREIGSDAVSYMILALILLLWYFVLGIKFEWKHITPLSEPSIFVRSFYSAFTFCTLGLLLYVFRFYKALHDLVVKVFGFWDLYNLIKAVVWIFLMYISYAYLVPWLFNILNTGASMLFNIANLVLYALPPVGISLVLSLIYSLFTKRYSLTCYNK